MSKPQKIIINTHTLIKEYYVHCTVKHSTDWKKKKANTPPKTTMQVLGV